jgi:hypothetical protein
MRFAVIGAWTMNAEPASPDLPTDADGEIDWVTVASMESFPASDAPAYPEYAGRPAFVPTRATSVTE